MALVSQRAYARRRGISQAAVWKRTTAAGGPIPTHGPRKLIDPDEADGLWEATQSPQGAGGAENGRRAAVPPNTLTQARAAAVVLDVRLRQLQLDQRGGALISRDRAVIKAFAFARTLRDMLQAWPARVGPQLAAEFGLEPAGFVVALEDAIGHLLDELVSERGEF